MNKYIDYIEKSAFVGGLAKGLSGAASGAGYLAKTLGRGLGKSLHYSVGGAYRDYAYKNMGITNPAKLAKISGNKRDLASFTHKFRQSPEFQNLPKGKMSGKVFQESPERLASLNKFKKDTIGDLQSKTNAGRMVVGGVGVGAAYGAHKLLTSPFRSQQDYSYNTY